MRWETEIARREAGAAAQRWRDHRAVCVECSRALSLRGGSRYVPSPCDHGAELHAAADSARRAAKACAELDKMPADDQEALF